MNKNQMYIGSAIVALGFLLLLGNVFHIDVGALIFPLILIALGIWLVLRRDSIESPTSVLFIGDVDKRPSALQKDENYWVFVGDMDIDLSNAAFQEGVTHLNMNGFVGDIDIKLPPNVGVSLNSTAFVLNVRAGERKTERIASSFDWKSDNYDSASQKLDIESLFFVSEIELR